MSHRSRPKAQARSPKPIASPQPASTGSGRRGRAPAASGPEIQTRYTPAGRETLAAIAEELGAPLDDGSSPSLEVAHGPAGRDTLAAIADELLEPRARERRRTVGFEDEAASRVTESGSRGRPARGLGPAPATAAHRGGTRGTGRRDPPPAEAPYRAHGPESLDAIEQHLDHWARTGEPGRPSSRAPEPIDVFEMITFVVRGELARLSSMTARREFVAERLLRRLPVESIEDVDRIDVTPWTVQGTVIVRVWCRV